MGTHHPDSVFDVLDAEFCRLIAQGFQIDCRLIDDALPQRKLSPLELKACLMHGSCSFATKDATWRYLIDWSRRDSQAMLITLGLLQPGMRRAAGRMVKVFGADPEEVDDELLTGVVETIANVDLRASRLASRLLTGGIDRVRRFAISPPSAGHVDERTKAVSEIKHPEVALWRAVEEKVVSAQDAELVATTRLDDDTLGEIAYRFGMRPDTLLHRRYRAEARLAAWVKENS